MGRLHPLTILVIIILFVFPLCASIGKEHTKWYDNLDSLLVDTCVSSYLNAYIWKNSSLATGLQSREDFIQYLRGNTSQLQQGKIAIAAPSDELDHVKKMWSDVSQYYGVSELLSFAFKSVDENFEYTCRQYHMFDDFDIVITSEEYFYTLIRKFRTGSRKLESWYTFNDFQSYSIVPMKILQFTKETNMDSIVSLLISHIDSNCTNSTFINLHETTQEIVYKLITTNNSSIYSNDEFRNFVKKFSSNSTELDFNSLNYLKNRLIDQFNFGSDSSLYYQKYQSSLRPFCTSCKNDFCEDVSFIETDYWIIPTCVMVILYFIFLFFTKAFMTPSMRRRLLIPYFPFIIIYIESQYLSFVLNYCTRARLLILGVVINFYLITYALTIIRLYLLRNMYRLLSIGKSNTFLKWQRILSGDIIGVFLTGGLAFIITSIMSLPFYFVFLVDSVYDYTNIIIGISLVIAGLMCVSSVIVDLIANRKKFSEKGFKHYILFDDPFMVRVELFALALITIVVIILATVYLYGIPDPAEIHFEEFLRFTIFLLVTINSGGIFTIKFVLSNIRRIGKVEHELSDIEQFLFNSDFRTMLQEYCMKEMSLENFVCFLNIEELERNKDKVLDLAIMKDFEKNYISTNSIYEMNVGSTLKKSFHELMKRCVEANSKLNKMAESELADTTDSRENLSIDKISSFPKTIELTELFKTQILQNLGDTLSRLELTYEFKNWYEVFTIQSKNQL